MYIRRGKIVWQVRSSTIIVLGICDLTMFKVWEWLMIISIWIYLKCMFISLKKEETSFGFQSSRSN